MYMYTTSVCTYRTHRCMCTEAQTKIYTTYVCIVHPYFLYLHTCTARSRGDASRSGHQNRDQNRKREISRSLFKKMFQKRPMMIGPVLVQPIPEEIRVEVVIVMQIRIRTDRYRSRLKHFLWTETLNFLVSNPDCYSDDHCELLNVKSGCTFVPYSYVYSIHMYTVYLFSMDMHTV